MPTVVSAAMLCCGALAGVHAQDAARGAALLTEARKAIGGEDRLRAVKTLDVRGDFKRAVGQTTIEGELQIRVELPDKLRRDEDLSPPGGGPAIILTEVLNGTAVWDESTGRGGFFFGRFDRGGGGRGGGGGFGGGAGVGAGADARGRGTDPAQVEEAQRRARKADLARFLLVWLLVADGPITWVGTAEAPDGAADVLEMTPGAGPVTRLFLDQASHMPLMITWRGAAPQMVAAGGRRGGRGDAPAAAAPLPASGQQATLQMTLDAYKAVNAIRLPHVITRGINDRTFEEWTIDSYRINPAFRADVFTK